MQRVSVLTHDPIIDIFKALSEPVRLDIMARIVSVDELACTTLEKDLPISKSTISYHMKILYRAHLIDIRKDGRFYHYRARVAEIEEIVPGLLQWLNTRSSAAPEPARRPTAKRASAS
jgi:ArsR family transcriptional regulator, arsenate/arsenite/antimonite-responsive transcriptional repressor